LPHGGKIDIANIHPFSIGSG